MQHNLTPGLLIKDRYKLMQIIGQGSFGEVWLAEDLDDNNNYVAIKMYQWLDRDGMDTFCKEMETTRDLIHPNLLIPREFDEWNQRPYLVMEYCAKGSVSRMAGGLSEDMAWRFIRDVAAGLAYLHGLYEPVVHQDVKPDNIVIGDDNVYRITDFGISTKVRDHLVRNSAQRNPNAGAMAYMAPERFTPYCTPLTSSDIWAFGVTVYELLSGRLPFNGMGGGMLKGGAEIPDIPQQYSERLNRLVKACLQKETWDRPTAKDIEEYASAVLRGDDPVGIWEQADQSAPAPVPPAIKAGIENIRNFGDVAVAPAAGSSKTKVIAATVAGLLAVGALLFVGVRYMMPKKADAATATATVKNDTADPAQTDLLADNGATDIDVVEEDVTGDRANADGTATSAPPVTVSTAANAGDQPSQPKESGERRQETAGAPVSTAGSGYLVADGDGYRGPEDTGRPQNQVNRGDYRGQDRNGYVSRDAGSNPSQRSYTQDSRYIKSTDKDRLPKKPVKKNTSSSSKTVAPIENELRLAINSGDYTTLKRYADAGNVNAYVPMADACIRRNEYANAEKYAKKAREAGVASANNVFDLLNKMGYYD